MHWHIATAVNSAVISNVRYDDGLLSVRDFLAITRSLFPEEEESPVKVEAALMHNVENENYPIYSGSNNGLAMYWIQCNCEVNPWEN